MAGRDYKKERATYDSKPSVMAKNRSRQRARHLLEKRGVVRKGDGKDVDHRNGNALDNSPKNLGVKSARANRSYPRNSKAGKR
jgi:5'-3' exonuclease